MQIKNLLFTTALVVVFGFSACSDDDENITVKDAKLKLISSKSEIVPFEDIKVSVDVDLELLYNTYDSITWNANGAASDYGFFGNQWSQVDDERDLRITDYRFGKYKVYVLGYKDGIVISKDSIEYKVNKPNADFISINWGQSTRDQYLSYVTGITPNQYMSTHEGWTKIGGVSLNLNHIVSEKDTEYATFRFMPWTSEANFRNVKLRSIPDINDFDWHEETDRGDSPARYDMEYTFHHNYLIELYGNPSLVYNGDDVTKTTLTDEYGKRFAYKLEGGYYPVEIWNTPSSNICLIRANNSMGGVNQKGICLVVAEPRK
ncbi:hypothetical protein CLV62_11921 [Dysgonomonas alginatilytica]|uniref:Uncharacterized protein n=1 Tax=Dysgonomonas alginatilytica TaxID=1605892 RepID=A0A2V3PTG3_9BACT|nr:hypothetical protein [Dysgonomonas alginatilytica]PXV62481.1 hypothetical protein CLV62_11921 [Dysgonomonas alginatilytica]